MRFMVFCCHNYFFYLLKLRSPLKKRYYNKKAVSESKQMNKDMIELYSDYLIASFGQTTATGLANLLQGSIYHDSITRF